LVILEVLNASPDDIARFPQVLGGIANLACTTIKSSLTLNPLSAITWSKKTFHCASKNCIHMFVALLIAQRF
jgi:hypothetical protein